MSSTKLLLLTLTVSGAAFGQMPAGFHWVDLRRDVNTVQKVEQALKAFNYTAIREIGSYDDFALVMTGWRDADQDVPDGDQWSVYNISLKNGTVQVLLTGYGVQIKGWFSFSSQGQDDLGIVYLHCWECEPTSLFTAFHHDARAGWRARWANTDDVSHPGIPFLFTDVGNPYTDEDVNQVFAVLAPDGGAASIGTWYHSRDLSTGKVADGVSRFSVSPVTDKDESTALVGVKAKEWKLRLCSASNSPAGLAIGQTSPACKGLLSAKHQASK